MVRRSCTGGARRGVLLTLLGLLLMSSLQAAEFDLVEPGGKSLGSFNTDRYGGLLLQAWRPDRPSMILVFDPNCPYCTKEVKSLGEYRDLNVFIVWAPILGPDSVKKVESYFRCDNPVGDEIFKAMLERRAMECEGAAGALFERNNELVAKLRPNSVPRIYFNGRRVSAREAKELAARGGKAAGLDGSTVGFATVPFAPVKLQWERYADLRLSEGAAANAAVVLDPNDPSAGGLLDRLNNDTRYNWHVFWYAAPDGNGASGVDKLLACDVRTGQDLAKWRSGGMSACDRDAAAKLERNEEFQLLLGVASAPLAVVDGRMVLLDRILKP